MVKRTPVLRLARVSLLASAVGLVIVDSSPGVRAQEGPVPVAQAGIDAAEADGVTPPPGYVIGAGDRLRVVFWREESMSAEVQVRPDGMISLPLLNDVAAAGLTPEELRLHLAEKSARFVDVPVSVVVTEITSRTVFITGEIAKPGSYLLNRPTSVMQLIAQAGGLLEWADDDSIVILRNDDRGNPIALQFDYSEVVRRRNLRQNIELQPGDTVVVP